VRAGERAAHMMVRAGTWGRGTYPAPTLCEHRFVTDALSKAYSYTSRSPCFPLRFSSDLHAAVARAMECEQSCCSSSALCGREVRVRLKRPQQHWKCPCLGMQITQHLNTYCGLRKQVVERTAGQVCAAPQPAVSKTPAEGSCKGWSFSSEADVATECMCEEGGEGAFALSTI